MNTRIDILGVEYRYFYLVAIVFMTSLWTCGVGLITLLSTGAVWAVGAALYAMNPQWLGVLILRTNPASFRRRYNARRCK